MQKPAIMLGASHQQTHITLQTDSAAGGSVTVERGRKTIDGVIIFLGAKALLHLRFIVWTTRQRLLEWIHNFTLTSFMEKKRIVS